MKPPSQNTPHYRTDDPQAEFHRCFANLTIRMTQIKQGRSCLLPDERLTVKSVKTGVYCSKVDQSKTSKNKTETRHKPTKKILESTQYQREAEASDPLPYRVLDSIARRQ
jgi:hypothetical protein